MPEIKSIYQYSSNYNSTSYVSELINMSEASSYCFSVFSSEDCTISIRHIFDNEHLDIVATDSKDLIGGECTQLISPVKSRYCQFAVTSIASIPCELQTEAFYFFSKTLQNASESGTELLNENSSQIKTIQSSNGSISITDGNVIDLKVGDNLVLNNLTVNGTQTTINTLNIASRDNYLLSNKNYGVTGTQRDCGFVSIIGATGSQYSILGCTGANNTLMVGYTGMTGLYQNDVFEICDSTSNLNDGIYQIDGVTGYSPSHYTIGVKSSPDYTFLNNSLTDQGGTGTIQKKYLSVIRYNPLNQLYETTESFSNTAQCNFTSLVLLGSTGQTGATGSQGSPGSTGPSGSNVYYLYFNYGLLSGTGNQQMYFNLTDTNASPETILLLASSNMTIIQLDAKITALPSGAGTRTISLYRNSGVSSTFTTTFNSGSSLSASVTGTESLSALDLFCLRQNGASPGTTCYIYGTLTYTIP